MRLLFTALGFLITQISISQVITCVPCDMLGMVMNVGSQETSISIYHSGQYMTHPQSENIFMWEFTNQQGNILHQDTIVDQQTIDFGHNWSLTDTINVTVHFLNNSANLDSWYISEGLPPNGSSINCLFEDQIYWETGDPTPWGSWTFIHNNPGVDLNTYHSIDQNEVILQGSSLDNDFYQNTYYNAFEELEITWEIINSDIPNEWDFSICFPECYPIGTTSGSNEFITNSSNYLNCHVYPNNIAGSGLIQMEIITDGLFVDTVSWIATANEGMMININENIYSKKLIKITDGLGQEVNHKTNQILFYIYDDGSAEKKFIVE